IRDGAGTGNVCFLHCSLLYPVRPAASGASRQPPVGAIRALFFKPLRVQCLVTHYHSGAARGAPADLGTRRCRDDAARAELERVLVEVRTALGAILGSRGTSDEDIGILDSLLPSFHDGAFDTWVGFAQVGCGALRGFRGAAFNLDALDRWALGNRGGQDSARHNAWANDADFLGVFHGQVLYTDCWNCASAVSGEQVSGHNCLGRARDRVIENKNVNGTWQVMLAVFGIRAVPLHAGVVEATANVRRHRHETTVRAISWHAFMFWIIREVDLRTV